MDFRYQIAPMVPNQVLYQQPPARALFWDYVTAIREYHLRPEPETSPSYPAQAYQVPQPQYGIASRPLAYPPPVVFGGPGYSSLAAATLTFLGENRFLGSATAFHLSLAQSLALFACMEEQLAGRGRSISERSRLLVAASVDRLEENVKAALGGEEARNRTRPGIPMLPVQHRLSPFPTELCDRLLEYMLFVCDADKDPNHQMAGAVLIRPTEMDVRMAINASAPGGNARFLASAVSLVNRILGRVASLAWARQTGQQAAPMRGTLGQITTDAVVFCRQKVLFLMGLRMGTPLTKGGDEANPHYKGDILPPLSNQLMEMHKSLDEALQLYPAGPDDQQVAQVEDAVMDGLLELEHHLCDCFYTSRPGVKPAPWLANSALIDAIWYVVAYYKAHGAHLSAMVQFYGMADAWEPVLDRLRVLTRYRDAAVFFCNLAVRPIPGHHGPLSTEVLRSIRASGVQPIGASLAPLVPLDPRRRGTNRGASQSGHRPVVSETDYGAIENLLGHTSVRGQCASADRHWRMFKCATGRSGRQHYQLPKVHAEVTLVLDILRNLPPEELVSPAPFRMYIASAKKPCLSCYTFLSAFAPHFRVTKTNGVHDLSWRLPVFHSWRRNSNAQAIGIIETGLVLFKQLVDERNAAIARHVYAGSGSGASAIGSGAVAVAADALDGNPEAYAGEYDLRTGALEFVPSAITDAFLDMAGWE